MRSRNGARFWIQPRFVNCNLTELQTQFPGAKTCWGEGITRRGWSGDPWDDRLLSGAVASLQARPSSHGMSGLGYGLSGLAQTLGTGVAA